MSLHVSCAACQMKENSEKRKSAHLPPPQAVLSGRSNYQFGSSTLVEGYRDHLTRSHACSRNFLFPFPPLHAPASSLKPHPGKIGLRVAPCQPAPFQSLKHRSSKPKITVQSMMPLTQDLLWPTPHTCSEVNVIPYLADANLSVLHRYTVHSLPKYRCGLHLKETAQ
ncbi:hypothetical protein TcG_10385 [Trypanosoma cruzi]|nr:hypothetical protein TcG_10385 [Trypanosoma cruzi]